MLTVADLRKTAAELRKAADAFETAAKTLTDLGTVNGNALVDARYLPQGKDLAKFSGVDAIYRVLLESSDPLSKDQISAILSARGKAIGANTLQSYLSRDKRFSSQGRGRWGLTRPPIMGKEKTVRLSEEK